MKDNPIVHRATNKRWYARNREAILAKRKANNPRRNAQLKARRDANPQMVQVQNHRRRSLTVDLTIEVVQQVYEENIKYYGTLTCYLCLNPVAFKKDHLEHKTPLSRGGTNERSNLDVACQGCNCRKHNKTEQEYRREYANI